MAGGKETPRQKMIGMMYLVLTALLAMNVSKEVVNAFVTIDQGQRKTLKAVEGKLDNQLRGLADNAKDSEKKYGAANRSAKEIHQKATDLIEHINLIKAKTFAVSIGAPVEGEIPAEVYAGGGNFLIGLDSVKTLVGIDNYDNNTNLMIGDDAANPSIEDNPDGGNYRGAVLREKLVEYRDLIKTELGKIDKADPETIDALNKNLDETFDFPSMEEAREAGGQEAEGWVIKNFYHVPLAASTAMLTTLQSQIRSAESDIVDQLFTAVEGKSYKFDELKSAVIPMATTVAQGSKFEADVFLAAYDTQNTPEIYLGNPGVKWDSIGKKLTGDSELLEMDGTVGKVQITAGGLGVQQREGMIIFKSPGLPDRKEGFKIDYSVVAPQLVVSPTKMNVFYRGVPNPVSVSVPGYTDKDVVASMSGGSMRNDGGGNYTVTVKSGTEAKVSATVTQPDGSKRSLGPVNFRIKRIPDPVPSFGQKKPSDNVIQGTAVRAAQGVRAVMEGFDFDINVTVASFKIVTVVNGEIREAVCQGNKLNAQARGLLDNMRRGQKFSIEQIKVNMPDGVRVVPSIALRII